MTDPYRTAGHIRASLAAIRDNYEPALNGTVPRDDSDAPRIRAQSPPPISPHILDVRAQAFSDLAYFCRFIKGEVNNGTITGRIEPTIETMCRFIDTWALALAEQLPDDAEQCRIDMDRHAYRFKVIINGEYVSRMFIMKPCPHLIWHREQLVPCNGMLIAYVKHGDALLPPTVGCDILPEHQWAPHEWPALGRRISA